MTPSLLERVQLVWMFRNFHILNPEVLTRHERTLVGTLCVERRLESSRKTGDPDRLCIIGTVEPAQRAKRKRPAGLRAPVESAAYQNVHSA